ncbi:hypothetical protein GMOD_00003839 [Pyrenophora seminiperda CCB06]|uniref:Uncharacterized protein n=1 Tax=Pyrenophora seminiperda CCB06 TaxID=1302712 RepID=A0A3M7M033_9PLEO|nr:hypothetical protein GMOD_00003839 [Pyrenophora seminiperda CCB06]
MVPRLSPIFQFFSYFQPNRDCFNHAHK